MRGALWKRTKAVLFCSPGEVYCSGVVLWAVGMARGMWGEESGRGKEGEGLKRGKRDGEARHGRRRGQRATPLVSDETLSMRLAVADLLTQLAPNPTPPQTPIPPAILGRKHS